MVSMMLETPALIELPNIAADGSEDLVSLSGEVSAPRAHRARTVSGI